MLAPITHRTLVFLLAAGLGVSAAAQSSSSGQTQQQFEPRVGQSGKDVVWVPTPQALVDKMLDMAKATPADFLMDLGSGDGITVITAAKRGITAVGIEYNPDMVALSQRRAAEAGVTAKATFRKADLFETDFSKATVITMFLLPDINLRLRPKLLDMKPGTRVVSNSFTMDDWKADETETITGECRSWCTAHLWIVPAKVNGTWRVGTDTLALAQSFQMLNGSLGSTPLSEGKMNGEHIMFVAGGVTYTGTVNGNTMEGSHSGGGTWRATRQ
jgi:hypothetical protein